MDNAKFTMFVWGLVDDTIEHVFLRFPEDPATRAVTYRQIAAGLIDLANDLDLE